MQKEIPETIVSSIKEHKSNLRNKVSLPLLSTYCLILVLFNWDILLYLFFQKGEIFIKINGVKEFFPNKNYYRVWCPILLAILYTFLFPSIQILLNLAQAKLKQMNMNLIRKEEINAAEHEFQIQQQLSGKQTLQELNNTIEALVNDKEKLNIDNDALNSQIKELITELKTSKNILVQSNTAEYLDNGSSYQNLISEEIIDATKKLSLEVEKMPRRGIITFQIIVGLFEKSKNTHISMVDIEKNVLSTDDIKPILILLSNNGIAYEANTGSGRVLRATKLGQLVLAEIAKKYKLDQITDNQ